MADRRLLRQALGEIVDNALKRQTDGSPIGLAASSIADRVEIRVVDTGGAIPDDDFDRLFAPLRRRDADRSELDLDLRLGVGRGLIEAMGGSVTAETTPGGGLTVVVNLASVAPSSPDQGGEISADSALSA